MKAKKLAHVYKNKDEFYDHLNQITSQKNLLYNYIFIDYLYIIQYFISYMCVTGDLHLQLCRCEVYTVHGQSSETTCTWDVVLCMAHARRRLNLELIKVGSPWHRSLQMPWPRLTHVGHPLIRLTSPCIIIVTVVVVVVPAAVVLSRPAAAFLIISRCD